MVVNWSKKNMTEAWIMKTMIMAPTRPMMSETTPAATRPAALKTAIRATKRKPAWMAPPDCEATILAIWPMTMRPAVAPQANWR